MTFIDKIKNKKNKQIQKQIEDYKKLFKDGTAIKHKITIGETKKKEKQSTAKITGKVKTKTVESKAIDNKAVDNEAVDNEAVDNEAGKNNDKNENR